MSTARPLEGIAVVAVELAVAADIAFARVNDMAGLSAHPELRRVTVDTPRWPVSFPAPAAIIDGLPRSYGPVPALGGFSA
jgi:itaconate CoA-transferase